MEKLIRDAIKDQDLTETSHIKQEANKIKWISFNFWGYDFQQLFVFNH